MSVPKLLETAVQHHQAGRLQEAEAAYRQVLAMQPNQPDALHLLGVLAFQAGQAPIAFELIRRAISLAPSAHHYYSNLARVLLAMGKVNDSVAAARRSIELHAENPDAYTNLAHALRVQGQLEPAMLAFNQALKLNPQSSSLHAEMGETLHMIGRLDEAIAALRRAAELNPNRSAIQNSLGTALHSAGRFDDAIGRFREAIRLEPAFAEAHRNLGMTLLLKGDLENGWPEHEWRWQTQIAAAQRQDFVQPEWDGSPLAGRRLLLWAEQGFGDTIQFARYAAVLNGLGAKVILTCRHELHRLLQGLDGVDILVREGERAPDFDIYCRLMSVPTKLKTSMESIPNTIPYLRADAQFALRWRERLPKTGLRVGLTWAGQADHVNDRNRSVPFEALSSFSQIDGVHLFSLQKDSKQVNTPWLTGWTSELSDFAETAALIDNLDLVITVDTAVAHLAGAMGKPVWVLLPHVPDWRWMLDRDDSPWYPTMKLFRQSARGDWSAPITRIQELLRQRSAAS